MRLTTMEIQIPRIVLAEFNTHRVFSRNSASSRAIPIGKLLARVKDDPYMPEEWTANGAGMQGHGLIASDTMREADEIWARAADDAVERARQLLALNVHKQTTNRLLEPFLWHTVIVTATEWGNFFNLRINPAAHPAIRNTAEAMRVEYLSATPTRLEFGDWHLPYVDERDAGLPRSSLIKLSTARCARVSYLTHDGVREPIEDIDLHDRLLAAGHMSPFEHTARPLNVHDVAAALDRFAGVTYDRTQLNPAEHFAGNFRGWMQYRKTIRGEADILGHRDGGGR